MRPLPFDYLVHADWSTRPEGRWRATARRWPGGWAIEPATPVVSTAATAADPGLAAQLRAEMAELMSIAAQAARLGVTVDAAEAMRRGIDPAALRRSVLDTLASRDVGLDIVAAAPVVGLASGSERPVPSADSPLIRAARAAAAASREV